MKDFLAKMKDFIKTPLGKVVLAAIALLAVLFVVAFLVGIFLIFTNLGGEPQEVAKAPVKVQTSTASTTTTAKESSEETEAAESEEQQSATFEVYEYKDPFEPLIKEEATSTATTTTTTTSEEETTTSSEETTAGPQVLEVQDIYTESGVKYSSVKYGATVYKVKEGDRVDESPYEVLTIGADSVTFLYGDRRVEVNVGESILK